jgi:lactoylglutathione lyase
MVAKKGGEVIMPLRILALLLAYLKSRGMAWEDWSGKSGEITLRPDGIHQIFLRDIDGHWIEVNDMPRVE